MKSKVFLFIAVLVTLLNMIYLLAIIVAWTHITKSMSSYIVLGVIQLVLFAKCIIIWFTYKLSGDIPFENERYDQIHEYPNERRDRE